MPSDKSAGFLTLVPTAQGPSCDIKSGSAQVVCEGLTSNLQACTGHVWCPADSYVLGVHASMSDPKLLHARHACTSCICIAAHSVHVQKQAVRPVFLFCGSNDPHVCTLSLKQATTHLTCPKAVVATDTAMAVSAPHSINKLALVNML